VSFFIWKSSPGLSGLLWYFLGLFSSIPAGGLLSAYLSEKTSPKISFSLGILSKAALLLAIVLLKDSFLSHLVWFGVLSGASLGFYAVPLNSLHDYISGNFVEKLTATNSAISGSIGVFIPTFGAFMLSFGIPYSFLFILSSICGLIAAAFCLFVKTTTPTDRNFEILSILSPRNLTRDKLILLAVEFVEGIKSGFLWAFGGIICLSLLNGIGKWGVFNFIFSSITVILSFVAGRTLNEKLSRPIVVATGFLYSLACLFLSLHFDLKFFVFYSFLGCFVSAFGGASFGGTLNRILREDPQFSNLRHEYFALREFPAMVGRILPLVVLLLLNTKEINSLGSRLAFVLVGFIPLISLSLLDISHLWKGNPNLLLEKEN